MESRSTGTVIEAPHTAEVIFMKDPAYEAAKLASDFDPQNRDENVDYYVAKLDDLVKKFSSLTTAASSPKQESLAL